MKPPTLDDFRALLKALGYTTEIDYQKQLLYIDLMPFTGVGNARFQCTFQFIEETLAYPKRLQRVLKDLVERKAKIMGSFPEYVPLLNANDKFLKNVAKAQPKSTFDVPPKNSIEYWVAQDKAAIDEMLNKQISSYEKIMAAAYKANAEKSAKEALNSAHSNVVYANKVAQLIPNILTTRTNCPMTKEEAECPCGCKQMFVCEHTHYSIWDLIQHLNDKHQWTREKIADWLDELHDTGIINLVLTNPNPDRG